MIKNKDSGKESQAETEVGTTSVSDQAHLSGSLAPSSQVDAVEGTRNSIDRDNSEAEHSSEKIYFPSNREDILHHLGSMAISSIFPSSQNIIATADGRPALL